MQVFQLGFEDNTEPSEFGCNPTYESLEAAKLGARSAAYNLFEEIIEEEHWRQLNPIEWVAESENLFAVYHIRKTEIKTEQQARVELSRAKIEYDTLQTRMELGVDQ